MKKKSIHNKSGIKVCDSIVMSVKKKNKNLRWFESLFIALTGYIATIMLFLTMFDFTYSKKPLIISAVIFSVVYIGISSLKKHGLIPIIISLVMIGAVFWKKMNIIAMGYKFVYNIIYKASYHTEINYYKFLDNKLESQSITTFFIFGAWVLAVVIYVFTIYHHHPLPNLLTCFPILEIGLYNGIKVNILWGMLVIGFLIASFAMSTIDTGEYSGGNGGFVRRENVFFPKRQMKLKVTEKCGVYLILIIMVSAGLSVAGIKLTNYKRSKEINEKRIEIRDAVNNFSADDLADSITELSAAFGLDIKFESHKLGTISSMKHKNRTDMIVTIDGKIDNAVYLKDYTGSVYNDNEWKTLSDEKYESAIFNEFDAFEIYPQDFPYCYDNSSFTSNTYNMYIKSEQRGNKSYAPYGTDYIGGMIYDRDMNVSSKKRDSKDYSYRFTSIDTDLLWARGFGYKWSPTVNVGNINDEEWRNKIIDYCERYGILENNTFTQINSCMPLENEELSRNPQFISTELLREEYEKFVYENYLQVPDTTAMQEVRETFAYFIDTAEQFEYPIECIVLLQAMRETVADMTKYSLSPGKTPGNRDFVNYFLLENNKGYCTHYATTGVMLARMLGIPARYATGYVIVGDDFNDSNMNPDGSYTIKVKDDRRHAWVEIYIDGYGWVPFEFTAGYSDQTIDTSPTTTTTTTTETTTTGTETTGTDMTETTVSDIEPENSSEQTSANNGGNNRSTTAVTTEYSGGGTGDKGENPILKAMKNVLLNILCTFLVIALIIVAFIARRKIVLALRKKRLSVKNPVKRIGNIYAYAEKLMKQVGVEFNTMSSRELSAFMEDNYGGVYFEQGEFEKFMNTSLYAVFSGSAPDMADVEKNNKLTKAIADNIYNRAGKLKKLYLKYILCLM
ncbi:MAG: transglutaminase domain-containing protein [Ruminococcus sp.]|nr:transglutaminase domain-containing protein [Ruminococcus sp.]